jgi:hypothetical protein
VWKETIYPNLKCFAPGCPTLSFPRSLLTFRSFRGQYGPLNKHVNEKARARFLSGYFNGIVALFSGLLFNKPEEILEGKLITKDRIEYLFKTYGGITVIFIEVKLDIGNLAELLDCYAQVIAECDSKFNMTLRHLANSFRRLRLAEPSEQIRAACHGDIM